MCYALHPMYCMMTSSKNSLFFLNCHTCQYFFHWTRTQISIYGLQHDKVIQRILMFLLAFEDSNEIRTLKFSMIKIKFLKIVMRKIVNWVIYLIKITVWRCLKHIETYIWSFSNFNSVICYLQCPKSVKMIQKKDYVWSGIEPKWEFISFCSGVNPIQEGVLCYMLSNSGVWV